MSRSVNMLRGGFYAGIPGAIIGYNTPTDEEVRAGRIKDLIGKYNAMRQKTLVEGTQKISKNVAGALGQSRGALARRAGAAGRSLDDANILSAERNILTSGTNAIADLAEGTNREFDRAIMSAEYEGAAAPIGPNALDVIEEVGSKAIQFGQNASYLSMMKGDSQPSITPGSFAPKQPQQDVVTSIAAPQSNIFDPMENRESDILTNGMFRKKKFGNIFGTERGNTRTRNNYLWE